VVQEEVVHKVLTLALQFIMLVAVVVQVMQPLL
jgi:hypothetical protein